MSHWIVKEDKSPWGNITACIEDDGDSIYFSLVGPRVIPQGETQETWSGFRTCWVSNKIPVNPAKPIEMSQLIEEMEKGKNPVMPGKHCANPESPPQLNTDLFEIVWFETGDCAVLLYKDEPIAVIPPWCTPALTTTAGYSKEFVGEEFIGIKPLKAILPRLSERIEQARKFWNDWDDEKEWNKLLASHTEALEKVLGPHSKMYAIDGEQWPPKVVLQFDHEDAYLFVTIGVSILAQPRVELFTEDFKEMQRIEWGIAVSKEIADKVSVEKIGEYLSKCVCLPWDQLLWLFEGCSINCDLFPPIADGSAIEAVLLTKDQLSTPAIQLPDFRGAPVNLLWAVPITTQELNFIKKNGSDQLFPILKEKGCSYAHKKRKTAVE